MKTLEFFLQQTSDLLWSWPLIVLLIGTHVFLTFRLKFIQRYIFKAIRISFSRRREGKGDISQFGALTTTLAATVGTGNIVGVATAIAAGGPGAVLWMWLTGFFGIATKYGEAVLSLKYRIANKEGSMAGGPMYVLERGMNARWLGLVFATFTAIAAFGIGNTVQANSIASLMQETLNVSPWITGPVLATLTATVILGGLNHCRDMRKTGPFMTFLYSGLPGFVVHAYEKSRQQ